MVCVALWGLPLSRGDLGVPVARTHRALAYDVTITKKWAWPTDFVWQEVYGKPLTTATSVVAKLPSVRLVL